MLKGQDACHTVSLVDYNSGSNVFTSLNKGAFGSRLLRHVTKFCNPRGDFPTTRRQTQALSSEVASGKHLKIAEITHWLIFIFIDLE